VLLRSLINYLDHRVAYDAQRCAMFHFARKRRYVTVII